MKSGPGIEHHLAHVCRMNETSSAGRLKSGARAGLCRDGPREGYAMAVVGGWEM